MPFGGTLAFAAAGARPGQTQYNILEITGGTLAANAGPTPDRAVADTGALSSNTGAIDPVLADTSALPAAFGKGPDNWAQADLDSLTILPQDSGVTVTKFFATKQLVANLNPAPTGSSITNSNAEILVQNLGAGASTGLALRIISEHTAVR